MARAICNQCQREFSWYGGRGMKLSDVISPCCHTSAHGKPGERKPSRKATLPKARMDVEEGYLNSQDWHGKRTATAYLRDDGLIEFSWPVGIPGQRFSVGECSDGFRVLIHISEGWKSYRRVLECDFQKLLALARPNTACSGLASASLRPTANA